jgi:Ricin-type beta-trefoil lectin domain
MKVRLTIAAAALGLTGTVLGLAVATPAYAATTTPIVNFNSGYCLGIAGGNDDAPAVQWTCDGSANQSWTQGSEYGNTSYFQIVNGDGQCLGVLGGSTDEGAPVYGWTCLGPGHPDQYWTVVKSSTHHYVYFVNLNSGLVLGVSGNSTTQGASVVQWANQNTPNNQLWTIPVASSS